MFKKIKDWVNYQPILLKKPKNLNRGSVGIMFEINKKHEHFEALGCKTTIYKTNLSEIEKNKIEQGLKLLESNEIQNLKSQVLELTERLKKYE